VAWWQLYIIIGVVAVIAVIAYFVLRKYLKTKMNDQEQLVNQHKITASILVLEKKKEKVSNSDIPKSVIAQIPKIYQLRKVPIVKAKIGPQVMDLLCDEKVFDKLPVKKTVQVEIAGIFIAGIKKSTKHR
jgi:hypothetical protein